MAGTSTIITYDELLAAGADDGARAEFVGEAIRRHRQSEMWRNARAADMYWRQRNVTIAQFTARLFTTGGEALEDFTASQLRVSSNLFRRLNLQRAMYSLGRGVSFVDCSDDGGEDVTKARMGDRFDDDVKRIGILALIHGVAFPFWNLDHVDVFEATEFAPIWDETTGSLRAGVRFWRIDPTRPLHAVLYEEDGWTPYDAGLDNETLVADPEGKRAYKATYAEVPADGLKLAVDSENYSRLPIIPVWGSDSHQSTLVGMREGIDAYDLIKSGLCNDVQDCAQVYWIVKNAGGMGDQDLARFRDRLRLTHIANVANADDGVDVQPYAQEVPYAARKEALSQIRADLYEDFGALDVHTVAAGATNDHIDAAYQPMDEEADEFERHIREGIMDLLALQGIHDTPVFRRNRISNLKEQVEVLSIEAGWLDEETLLRKLPNVTPDEVQAILRRKSGEDADRLGFGAEAGGAGDGLDE